MAELQPNDLTLEIAQPARGVTSVYHQLGMFGEPGVIDLAMIGDDHHAIGFADSFNAQPDSAQSMAVSFKMYLFDVRIVELRVCAEGLQLLDDPERGAFPHVVDVALVSHADNQNLRSVDRLAMIVQPARHQGYNVIGHARIDLFGQRDETR